MTIRVVVCDDQDLVREGLRAILSNVAGIEVVGEATNGVDVLDVVAAQRPDVVLMDLKMPGGSGVQATREIVARHPEVRVLVLTTYAEPELVMDSIRTGASGYLLKDTPRDRLVDAIRGTVEGGTHVDPAVAGQLFDRVTSGSSGEHATSLAVDLTDRELEVLRLLGRGLSNADIAGQLFLSEGTVRNYVSSLLAKLGVADRTQAAVLAVRHGLA